MNVADATSWMESGFLAVEGAMATEIATAKQLSMTEDFIRGAMLRGLMASRLNTAGVVVREFTPSWAKHPCWNDPTHVQGKGRKPQVDVAIVDVPSTPDEEPPPLVVCELKWLTASSTKSAELIAKDIWKIAFTLSTSPTREACKGYLLIGGKDNTLSATLERLKPAVKLSWSAAGRPRSRPRTPEVNLGNLYGHQIGHDALRSLLKWGKKPHYRQPPPTWWTYRADCLQTWYRTTRSGVRWRIALWEVHHRRINGDCEFDWTVTSRSFGFSC